LKDYWNCHEEKPKLSIKGKKSFTKQITNLGEKMQPGHNTRETSSALWNAALLAPSAPSKGKGRLKKSEVIHFPEFEKASALVKDSFWRDILRSCARKKFPRGFGYLDGFLHHRANNIYIALPDDPYALAQTAIFFFQENGRMYSKHDREMRRQQEEENILSELTKTTSNWTTMARSKNRRATHVRDFVERKYAHLPKTIRNELYTQINVAFEMGHLKKENVIFENGQLLYVDIFDANEEGLFLTKALPNTRSTIITRDPQSKDKIYRHYEAWLKYLEDYKKYIISSAKSSHTIQTSSYSGSGQRTQVVNSEDD